MAESKTIRQIKSQLRNPQDVDTLRMLLKRYKKRLQAARLTVVDGYLHYAGTVGQAVSYWMRGVNYLRTKGTLDRKAFRKRKCFENSRKSAKRFARGNELASFLYAMVMKSRKTYVLFCFLKRKSILLIKEGKTVEEAQEIMVDYLQSFGLIKKQRRQRAENNDLPLVANSKEIKQQVYTAIKSLIQVQTVNEPAVFLNYHNMFDRSLIQDDS